MFTLEQRLKQVLDSLSEIHKDIDQQALTCRESDLDLIERLEVRVMNVKRVYYAELLNPPKEFRTGG